MVHRGPLIAIASTAVSILLGATAVLGSGLSSNAAGRPVNVAATGPAPTTGAAPSTVATTVTVAPTPATVSAVTIPVTTSPPPPKTAAPRPPTTPAAPRPVTTQAPPPPRPPVTSRPALSTLADTSDFSLIGYRWNPCQTITVSSVGPDVSGIVAELAGITGLHLQMVASGGQITVGMGATPAGGEVGQTDWRSVGPWLVSANITLNVLGVVYMPTLLRHELAHALGLGHANHPNEIMYPNVGLGSPTDYQAGDLAGLHAVGFAGGCNG